ncbi:MAG: glycosyltransferase family 4 protein [Bacillota bacterium]
MPERPLSILHTESSTGWGGQEIRTLTESRGMLDRGHRVTIVTPANAQMLPVAKRMGIPVEAIDIERRTPGSFGALRRWLAARGDEFDVVNTHSSTDSWLVALASATLANAPPAVRTRHVSTAVHPRPWTRWLYLHAAKHIVTTGEALREQLVRDNGFPPDHLTSVRTGIDLERFRPLDRDAMRARLGLEAAPTLGILATLRDWKGHEYLLEAFARLRSRFTAWRLLVVGDGPYRPTLEALTDRLQLRDAVRYLGNRDDVPECLSSLDLFALPSYGDEGVPQGIMQAMACGLAVVSTPIGAIGEAVRDGVTGILVRPRDAAALADALGAIMGDDARRAAMAQAGLAYARANFGIDAMLDAMERIFRRYGRTR